MARVLIGNYVVLSQQKDKDQLTTEAWPKLQFWGQRDFARPDTAFYEIVE